MTAARAVRPDLEVGCVLTCENGVLVVLTDDGSVRATYGARMLRTIARDRSRQPAPGEWVSVRRWCDGPVTIESALTRSATALLAQVFPLRRSARPRRGERGLSD